MSEARAASLALEPFPEFFAEGIKTGIFDEHASRVGSDRAAIWKINYKLAESLSNLGMLLVLVAREAPCEAPCGYNVAMISPRLEDCDLIAATFYLFASKPGLGLRLVREMAKVLRERNCSRYYL